MDIKRTILVVDDDPMVREFLALVIADNFSDRDIFVVEARDGAEGLEMARTLHPFMIITDVWMPKLDGLAFVRQLRADPITASMSVIMISATTSGQAARAAGCDLFVPKPFDLDQIVDAIEHWLSLAAAPDPAAHATKQDRAARVDEHVAANRARIAEIRAHLRKQATEVTTLRDLIVVVKAQTDTRLAQALRRRKLAEDKILQFQLQQEQSQDQFLSLDDPGSP